MDLITLAIVIILIIIILYILKKRESFIDYYDESPTLILYKANWCPHCKVLIPVWDDYVKSVGNLPVKFVIADDADDSDIMVKHGVKSFPTIRFYKNGLSSSNFIEFKEDRTKENIAKFVEENM